MNLTCPECKNGVNLSLYKNLAVGHIIECDICGITLEATAVSPSSVMVEVVDEGK